MNSDRTKRATLFTDTHVAQCLDFCVQYSSEDKSLQKTISKSVNRASSMLYLFKTRLSPSLVPLPTRFLLLKS